MCLSEAAKLRDLIGEMVREAGSPLSTEAIVRTLEAKGHCDFHIRRALQTAQHEGILRTSHSGEGSPIHSAQALWSPAPSEPGGEASPLEIIDPHRWAIYVKRILGRGGNGIVYVGKQLSIIDREAAIKLLAPELLRNSRGETIESKRLIREIKVLSRLSHPNIITVYDGGVSPTRGSPYLAMEKMEWPTLWRLVQDQKALPTLLVAKFMRAAATGLQYAWDRLHLLHRDLKPANLFADPESGSAKVADFGLASFDESTVDLAPGDTSISRNLAGFVGTPAFQAPERYEWGARGDLRSDLYSLGQVFYWALSGGQSPFNLPAGDNTLLDWLNAHRHIDTLGVDIQHPSRRPDCPPRLAEVLRRLLRFDPAERPQTYADLIRDLDRIIRSLEPRTLHAASGGAAALGAPGGTPAQGAATTPAAQDPAEMARLLDRVAGPSPTPDGLPTSTRFQPAPAYVEPEDLAALSARMGAVEDQAAKLFNPDALYLAGQPLLRGLVARAQAKDLIPTFRSIYELASDRETPDFEEVYRRIVAGEDLPPGTPDLPVSPTRYFYDAHEIALHSADLDRVARARGLAERLVLFLEESLGAPEILAKRSEAAPRPEARSGAEAPRVQAAPPRPSSPGTKVLPAVAPLPLPAGEQIGPLRIIRTLGQGGMGTVYLAHDESLDREVAVKVLNPAGDSAQEESNRRMFERELKIAARLRHPNIVQIHQTFKHESRPCLVMEFVEGSSLSNLMRLRGRFPFLEALKIARQAAAGLGEAHRNDLVHRDIKPDNILVEPGGRAVITDFGLMKSIRMEGPTGPTGTFATVGRDFVGTPHYCSPEQANAFPVDRRSDIYSLGATLYEMLTGERPYAAPTPMALLHRIADEKAFPRPLSEFLPKVPSALQNLINRMMAKRPEGRFANCEELIAEIDRVVAGLDSRTRPVPRYRPRAGILGGLLAALFVAGAAYLVWSLARRQETPGSSTTFLPPPSPLHDRKHWVPARFPSSSRPEEDAGARIPPPSHPPSRTAPTQDLEPKRALSLPPPSKEDLALLEEFLAQVSRPTLSARSAYDFVVAYAQVLAFRRQNESRLTPWLALVIDAERDRFEASFQAWKGRPLLNPETDHVLTLRDGRVLQGTVLEERPREFVIELATGIRETLPLEQLSPMTFPSARGDSLQAVLLRSAAGDAIGSLGLLAPMAKADRDRLLPLLLDQALEEGLLELSLRKNPRPLASLVLEKSWREVMESLLPLRLRLFDAEGEAARLYLQREDKKALGRLLLEMSGTRAGWLASNEVRSAFEKEMEEAYQQSQGNEETKFDLELIGQVPWGLWSKSPDPRRETVVWGSIVPDFQKDTFTLSSSNPDQRAKLELQMSGRKKGFSIRWKAGAAQSESTTLEVALSPDRWVEVLPGEARLLRRDRDPGNEAPSTTLTKRISLGTPVRGGTLLVFPRSPVVLVYLGDRLLFALDEKEWGLGERFRIQGGGGEVILESLRVLERTKD